MLRRGTALIALVIAAAAVVTVIALRLPRPGVSQPVTDVPQTRLNESPEAARADVTLDTRRRQLIGVRTVIASRATLLSEIRAAGSITYDETRQAEINTRVDGWIRELYADYTGRPIRRGEPLFTLYSPDLIVTQNEYLLALRGQSHADHDAQPNVQDYAERLVAAARDRLLRLDMSAEDIDQLRETGRPSDTIMFRAPVSGVIVEKVAVRGMRVMAGQTLYRVADLSSVWVEAEVYERDLAAVRTGVRATISVQAYPDRSFPGRVSYIAPIVSPETRTVRTRITLPNPGGLLKPNMVASVALRLPQSEALVVPPDAVVETGTQRLVFVADGSGHFAPREVRVGRRTADQIEIISGLTEGEQVAASATFFLDSESQLRGALQSYQPPATGAHADGHDAAPALDVAFRTEPDPPKPGKASLIVTVKDAGGTPVAGADVSAVLFMAAMPTMNMPAMKAEAKLLPVSDGVYRGTGEVMTPGRWEVTVSISKGGRVLATRQFALTAR